MTDQITMDQSSSLSDQISKEDLERLADLENSSGSGEHNAAGEMKSFLDFDFRFDAETDGMSDLRQSTLETDEEEIDWVVQRNQAVHQRVALQQKTLAEKRQRFVSKQNLKDGIEVLGLSILVVLGLAYISALKTRMWWDRRSNLQRGTMMIATSIIILLGSGLCLSGEIRALLKIQNAPKLEDALVAPHDLEVRFSALPPDVPAWTVLPQKIAGYELTTNTITKDNPSGLMNHCLLGIKPAFDELSMCNRMYGALDVASGRYLGKRSLDMSIARFGNEAQADRTLADMLHYARNVGQVGDFSILDTTGQVDYFYSAARGWYSFSWTRGPWMFTISTTYFDDLEKAVKEFTFDSVPVVPNVAS